MKLKSLVLAAAFFLSSCAYQVVKPPEPKLQQTKECAEQYQIYSNKLNTLPKKIRYNLKGFHQLGKACQYYDQFTQTLVEAAYLPYNFRIKYGDKCPEFINQHFFKERSRYLSQLSNLEMELGEICPE